MKFKFNKEDRDLPSHYRNECLIIKPKKSIPEQKNIVLRQHMTKEPSLDWWKEGMKRERRMFREDFSKKCLLHLRSEG